MFAKDIETVIPSCIYLLIVAVGGRVYFWGNTSCYIITAGTQYLIGLAGASSCVNMGPWFLSSHARAGVVTVWTGSDFTQEVGANIKYINLMIFSWVLP